MTETVKLRYRFNGEKFSKLLGKAISKAIKDSMEVIHEERNQRAAAADRTGGEASTRGDLDQSSREPRLSSRDSGRLERSRKRNLSSQS